MRVTVIIAARNAETSLGDCVSALTEENDKSHDGEVDLIVVDDGSTDRTAEIARESGAEVLSIPRSGPAVARNHGAHRSHGDILLFTDADCVPDRGWIGRMVKPFLSPGVIATKGTYRTEQGALTARFVQCEYESRYQRMRQLESIDFVDTYSAGYRADLFRSVGGFDESFPTASVEDQEFSFRYGKLGGSMVFVPEAIVCHRHADTPWRYFRKKLKIGYWKTRVIGRHPKKIIHDSHTPQMVKAEMLCALGILASSPFATTQAGAAVCLALATALLTSALPFISHVLKRDRKVGIVAPFFVGLRALGLGLGCVAGSWHVIGRRTGGKACSPRSRPRVLGAGHAPAVEGHPEVEEKRHELV